MRYVRSLCILTALVSLAGLSTASAHAQVVTYSGGTYTIDAAHSVDTAIVGRSNTLTTVNIVPGGSIRSQLIAYSNSQTNLVGGTVSGINAYEDSHLSFSSGVVQQYADLRGASQTTMSGGTIGSRLQTLDSSSLNVTGGTVSGVVLVFDSSHVTISGGTFNHGLEAQSESFVTISGGTFGLYNGSANFALYAYGGNLTLVGYNLRADVLSSGANGALYALSGSLQDGTSLAGYTLQDDTNQKHFTLQNVVAVPEPGSVALLVGIGMTGAGLLLRCRKAHRNAA